MKVMPRSPATVSRAEHAARISLLLQALAIQKGQVLLLQQDQTPFKNDFFSPILLTLAFFERKKIEVECKDS